jgi:hypothetical protein
MAKRFTLPFAVGLAQQEQLSPGAQTTCPRIEFPTGLKL